jgi:hypothetical protein
MRFLAMLFVLFASAGEASAHQTRLSYVSVEDEAGTIAANVKISFLDLEVSAGIDQDFDGRITWGEAKAAIPRVAAYVQSHTAMSAGGPCVLRQISAAPEMLNGEGYLDLGFGVMCPGKGAAVQVASTMFLEIDPTSRVLVSSRTGGEAQSYVLGIGDKRAAEAALGAQTAAQSTAKAPASLLSYFEEGVSHLFGGPDHMLFLLVLVIPAIYAGNGIRSVAIAVLLPVTGFTLGHALTLTSAASGLIRPPAQIVEILIAVTILLTAIDNIRAFIPGPRSVVAFAFGLIHGFGFASALGALEVSGWQMAVALLGFNLGIEAGQAMLALAVAPALYVVREPARRLHVLPTGVSVLAGLMAVFWIVQRAGLV